MAGWISLRLWAFLRYIYIERGRGRRERERERKRISF
jgi:hypothetical protein